MAYTAPTTRSTGNLITASIWNTDLVNNIIFLANKPSVRVRKSAGQSINNITDTLLTWDTEDWDTDTMHDVVTNTGRLIAKTAGKYRFRLQTDWDGNTAGQRTAYVGKNTAGAGPVPGSGRLAAVTGPTGIGDMEVSVTGELSMAVNDYIEAFVWQNSGAIRTFGAAQRVVASFSMEWISF